MAEVKFFTLEVSIGDNNALSVQCDYKGDALKCLDEESGQFCARYANLVVQAAQQIAAQIAEVSNVRDTRLDSAYAREVYEEEKANDSKATV